MSMSSSTRLGRDIRAHIPGRDQVDGYIVLGDAHSAVWDAALPYLQVRNNDRHSLYAYGVACALLSRLPEADAEVVLPAILLHDVGWSAVAEGDVLEAIAPGSGRHDLVRRHEVEGARIARGILTGLGYEPGVVDRVAFIIDGHDTRPEPTSLHDAVVKDADKIWRLTPDGLAVVCGWFGLTRDEALRICCARVHDALFTEPGRAMARAFAAVAAIDLSVQRERIGS
jgi:hypothetical protein